MSDNFTFISNGVLSTYSYNNQGAFNPVSNLVFTDTVNGNTVSINTTSISIANSTSNIHILNPSVVQSSSSNYWLNANGQWAQITSSVSTIDANNCSYLLTRTWVSPGSIGLSTPNTGNFTSLTAANIALSTNLLSVGASLYVVSNGNVGINNANPTNSLSVNGSTYIGSNFTVTGNSTVVNVYSSGSVNAASHTVGTSTIANSSGVYTTTVNAASHTVGTSTIANSSGVYSAVINATSGIYGTIQTISQPNITANNSTYAFGLASASTTATGSTVVTRDTNGDFTGRYINSSYFNSSDDTSTATAISYLMAKKGDNYHRSATAAQVATFLSGQTLNISGSATSTPLLSALANYTWSASSTPTAYNQGIQTSFVSAAQGFQNYGSVMTMNTYSGGGGALQLYVPYGPSNGGTGLQARFGNYDVSNGNSWTAWKVILADDNYSSYCNFGTNSVYGGIFYDGNNTGYYFDGNNTSSFNKILIAGTIKRNAAGVGYLDGQYSGIENSTTTGPIYSIGGSYYPTGTSLNTMYGVGYSYSSVTGMPSDMSGWGFYVAMGGTAYGVIQQDRALFSGSVRSPLFYDRDNTGYYCDPASTSNLNGLSVAATISGSVSGSANYLNNAYAYTNGGDGWWRSTGNAGWYNATYAAGIYASAAQFIQTYNSSSFQVNGNLTVTGTGGRTLLATLSASSSATLATTALAGYRYIEILFSNIVPVTTSTTLQLQWYAGGYLASGYQEYIAIFNGGGSAAYAPTTYIDLSGSARVSNTAGNGYTGRILLMNANQGTGYKQCIIDSGGLDTGTNNYNRLWGTAQLNTTTAITGFQMYMSSGNISTGTVQVWGWN